MGIGSEIYVVKYSKKKNDGSTLVDLTTEIIFVVLRHYLPEQVLPLYSSSEVWFYMVRGDSLIYSSSTNPSRYFKQGGNFEGWG